MTFIVGMNTSDIAIIASDTREVSIANNQVISFHDEANKIQNIGIGFMTGSGFVELLEPVKKRTSEKNIAHTDEITKIVDEERKAFRNNSPFNSYITEDIIRKTGWMFSYRSSSQNDIILRIGILHLSLSAENKIALVLDNSAKISVPSDITTEQAIEIQNEINKNMVSIVDVPNYSDNLGRNITLIKHVMREVSHISETVSEGFYVGLLYKNGDMSLSNIIHNDSSKYEFNSV